MWPGLPRSRGSFPEGHWDEMPFSGMILLEDGDIDAGLSSPEGKLAGDREVRGDHGVSGLGVG